jgi:hypothetical protein
MPLLFFFSGFEVGSDAHSATHPATHQPIHVVLPLPCQMLVLLGIQTHFAAHHNHIHTDNQHLCPLQVPASWYARVMGQAASWGFIGVQHDLPLFPIMDIATEVAGGCVQWQREHASCRARPPPPACFGPFFRPTQVTRHSSVPRPLTCLRCLSPLLQMSIFPTLQQTVLDCNTTASCLLFGKVGEVMVAAGHSRGGKLATLLFAAGTYNISAAYLLDPVDVTTFTPDSPQNPSAARALREKGLPVGITGAGIKSSCNPEEGGYGVMFEAAGDGSWLSVIPGASHGEFADGGAVANEAAVSGVRGDQGWGSACVCDVQGGMVLLLMHKCMKRVKQCLRMISAPIPPSHIPPCRTCCAARARSTGTRC